MDYSIIVAVALIIVMIIIMLSIYASNRSKPTKIAEMLVVLFIFIWLYYGAFLLESESDKKSTSDLHDSDARVMIDTDVKECNTYRQLMEDDLETRKAALDNREFTLVLPELSKAVSMDLDELSFHDVRLDSGDDSDTVLCTNNDITVLKISAVENEGDHLTRYRKVGTTEYHGTTIEYFESSFSGDAMLLSTVDKQIKIQVKDFHHWLPIHLEEFIDSIKIKIMNE